MHINLKFVHTNIVAHDWKLLSEFYQSVFNCKPIPPERNLKGDWIDSGTGISNVNIQGIHLLLPGYDKDGPTLEIFQFNKISTANQPQINRPGLAHIAFYVDDVKTALEILISKGGSKLGEAVTKEIPEAGTITFVYTRDPEGNIIELQKWK